METRANFVLIGAFTLAYAPVGHPVGTVGDFIDDVPAGHVVAIDNGGRLYVVSTGGIHVFSPKGDLLGTIPVSLAGQNIAFAGPDKKTLYIVGRGAAWKVQMLTPGFLGRAK